MLTCGVLRVLTEEQSDYIPYISSCILPEIKEINGTKYFYNPCNNCIKCQRIMHCFVGIGKTKDGEKM
jgi:hypothetical protein